MVPRVVADPHPRLRDHPHDPWVSLDQVADHEEARRSVEPLEDVHHLFRLDGPRAVVERQRDLAVRDAATDGNLARRHHVAGDRAATVIRRIRNRRSVRSGLPRCRPARRSTVLRVPSTRSAPSFTRMASPDARRVSLGAAPPFNSMRPGELAGSRTAPETDRADRHAVRVRSARRCRRGSCPGRPGAARRRR